MDPIQKRAPARSVQLEAVYLEALLYIRSEKPPRNKNSVSIIIDVQLHISFLLFRNEISIHKRTFPPEFVKDWGDVEIEEHESDDHVITDIDDNEAIHTHRDVMTSQILGTRKSVFIP